MVRCFLLQHQCKGSSVSTGDAAFLVSYRIRVSRAQVMDCFLNCVLERGTSNVYMHLHRVCLGIPFSTNSHSTSVAQLKLDYCCNRDHCCELMSKILPKIGAHIYINTSSYHFFFPGKHNGQEMKRCPGHFLSATFLRNDALGYFLWARCQLALAGKMPFTGDHLKLCGRLVVAQVTYAGTKRKEANGSTIISMADVFF